MRRVERASRRRRARHPVHWPPHVPRRVGAAAGRIAVGRAEAVVDRVERTRVVATLAVPLSVSTPPGAGIVDADNPVWW